MHTESHGADTKSASGGFVFGLGLGLGLAALVLCLGAIGGALLVKRETERARHGWNLVPVVVATVDIEDGTAVSMEMIGQRSIPEQFVTKSLVRPVDVNRIIGRPLRGGALAGEPVRWEQVREAGMAEVVEVLVAAHNQPAGATLRGDDVRTKRIASSLATTNWVRPDELPRALARSTLVSLHEGDPLLWSMLQER